MTSIDPNFNKGRELYLKSLEAGNKLFILRIADLANRIASADKVIELGTPFLNEHYESLKRPLANEVFDKVYAYKEAKADYDKGSAGLDSGNTEAGREHNVSPATPQPSDNYQQLDAVNNRVELEKDNWLLLFKCCDCGLIHKMSFALEDNGNLGIAIDRQTSDECKVPGCVNGRIKRSPNWKDAITIPCPKCGTGKEGD